MNFAIELSNERLSQQVDKRNHWFPLDVTSADILNPDVGRYAAFNYNRLLKEDNLQFQGGYIMQKKIIVIFFIVSMVAQVRLSWGDTYNFRYTRWGMTPEEVIAAEKMDPVEKDGKMIKYKTQILNKNVELLYLFAQNKLIGASYKLDENYLNSDRFINTYARFKEELIKKYGPPKKDVTHWNNETFKSDRSKWGKALSFGYLEYISIWETPDTTVSCGLKENNFYVLCSVDYWSMEFSNLLDRNKQGDKPNPF